MKLFNIFFALLIPILFSCSSKKKVDMVVYNGHIYTVDSAFSKSEAFAILKGKIIAIGQTDEILNTYDAPQMVDAKSQFIYPGFIDAHCHFYGYSTDLLKCDLYDTKSLAEILQRTDSFAKTNKFSWLLGRGWDQNDWANKAFPTKEKLDSIFPTLPVFLMRIDGHAALCNSKALELAGITNGTKVDGGEIILVKGKLSGLLIDNAVDLVKSKIPPFSKELISESILQGQQNCFAAGLTTLDEAGLGKDSIETLIEMQKDGRLKIRIYAMISDHAPTLKYYFEKGPYESDRLNVRAVKVYADGALGSRGACMKSPYNDLKNHYGFLLQPATEIRKIAAAAFKNGFQLCTHAIGDSANKLILDIYAQELKGKNDKRWRIEHCQVVSQEDRQLFGDYSILPSVQPTHATSDMYWAEDRIGKRIKDAYAYNDLMKAAGNKIAFGTDFPVEHIEPIYTFYAAVARKDLKAFPRKGFQMENAVSRKDALRAMTIWAAYSNFEESKKGSIEKNKYADFVILDKDILTCDEKDIPKTKVIATYVNGEQTY